jgi:hypothetical protein
MPSQEYMELFANIASDDEDKLLEIDQSLYPFGCDLEDFETVEDAIAFIEELTKPEGEESNGTR